MAEPYATPSQAKTFYAGEAAEGVLLNVPMQIAADLVQHYAPVPDPVPADYPDKAAYAELVVGKYLYNTDFGTMTGSSLSGVGSTSYSDNPAIFRIISRTMGAYASAGRVRILRIERA